MSAATSQPLPRSHSTRRQHGYSATAERTQGPSLSRSGTSDGVARSASQSQAQPSSSHSRSSSNATGSLAHVKKGDAEQLNLARPSTGNRSDSRDRPSRDGGVSRTDSTRNAPSSRPSHSRQPSEAVSANGTGQEGSSRQAAGEPQATRRRTTVETKSGVWELGKTIGAGSMGKVKLARHRETHEQVAVKIVPRQSTDEHKTAAEKERADHSKEVRTARESAISTLIEHPYICGMKDVIKTRYHWYMLFEYVNGGQMLDYIISHGRLKEKQARKFGRQIASALDYCHRNSIVHRDLKIENILISKTGDIKIIDFGLSNTFQPKGHLKTFCGSLYFAAPELLQAKQYTGPEVDVWSFGIVLYVLVCGKVPFDDQSMPQLHAKIKKGHVDYPPWLSHECRTLIARMLQTDPLQRASMAEIMNHPWMTKGFGGPPDNFLPARKPLQTPLERNVIRKMDGFDFGSANGIEERLGRMIDGEDYQRAIINYTKKISQPTPEVEKKRGVFDFYKRRNSLSRDTLQSSSSEAIPLGSDPLHAFDPLVSVYFLAKEKMEREARAANPAGGAPAVPEKSKDGLAQTAQSAPILTAPPAAYTNAGAYEMAGEAPTGGRARPRARTHGQDEMTEDMKHIKIEDHAQKQTIKKESTAAGILRKLSTRRPRNERPVRSESVATPAVAVEPPAEDSMSSVPRKSFSIRRRDQSSGRTPLQDEVPSPKQPQLLSPEPAADATRRQPLGRSTSVNSGDYRQRLSKRPGDSGAMWSTKTPSKHKEMDAQTGRANDGTAYDLEAPHTAPAASRTKSLGHARKESIQRRRRERAARQTANVPEETDAELAENDEDAGFSANESGGSPSGMRPVFLKGLFSVSTTSSKPFKVIESDLVRVLRQLHVQYSSNGKGGFKCKYTADGGKLADEPPQVASPALSSSGGHRRKLSFGGFMTGGGSADKDKERERERERDQVREDRLPSERRAGAAPLTPTTSRSKDRRGQQQLDLSDDDAMESELDDATTPSADRKGASSYLTGAGGAQQRKPPAGETSTHVQDDMAGNRDLRFEIFVVKVPLLSLHGIQFKKVDGGTWQYKNMAQSILDELKL